MVLKLVMVDPSKSGRGKVRSNTFYHFGIGSTGKFGCQNGDGSIVLDDRKVESTKESYAPIMVRQFGLEQRSSPLSKVDGESHNTTGQTHISISEKNLIVRQRQGQGQGQVERTNTTDRFPSSTANSDLDLAGENVVSINKRSGNHDDTSKKMKFIFLEPMTMQTGPPERRRVARKNSSAFEERQHTIILSQSKRYGSTKPSSVLQPLRVNKAVPSSSHSTSKQGIPKGSTDPAQQINSFLSPKANGSVTPQKSKSGSETKFKFCRVDPQQPPARRHVTYTFKVNLKDNGNKQSEGSSSITK